MSNDYNQYSIEELITYADYLAPAKKSVKNASQPIQNSRNADAPLKSPVIEEVSSYEDLDEDVDDVVGKDLVDEDGQEDERVPVKTKDSDDEDNHQEDASEDTEVVIEVGGIVLEQEEPKEDHESWVKRIRKENRELKRANKQLQAQTLERPIETSVVNEVFRDQKPTLESSDYDSDLFQKNYEEWYENKARHQENVRARKAQEDEQNKVWNQKLQNYEKMKEDLRLSDMDEAEEFVSKMFNKVQAGILIQGAKDPAKVVYTLSKHKGKCKELASISDPIVFAMELGKYEGDGIKFYPRKRKESEPERGIKGHKNTRDVHERIREAFEEYSDDDFVKFCDAHPELHSEIKHYLENGRK